MHSMLVGKYVASSLLVVGFLCCVVGTIMNPIVTYNTKVYPVSQAENYLWRARATNDLASMAGYFNQSLALLAPFHGNPAYWWYPKPDTDLDLIKQDITTDMLQCINFTGVPPENMSYQLAVQDLQETINELTSHLDSAKNWLQFNPFNTWLEVGFVVGSIVFPILAGITISILRDALKEAREKAERDANYARAHPPKHPAPTYDEQLKAAHDREMAKHPNWRGSDDEATV